MGIWLQCGLAAVRQSQTRPATERPLCETVSWAEHGDENAPRREAPELLRELHGAEVRTAASAALAQETACGRISRTSHPQRSMDEEDPCGHLDGHALESLNRASSSLRRTQL